MSLTEMKGVHIFYLHCTCYKFRIAVLIFDRINAVCAKSLDIPRSVSLFDENNINLFSKIYFLNISRRQITRIRCFKRTPDYSEKISQFHLVLLHFRCAKIVTERVNFYLINLLSKCWCQKSLSKTIQHVGLLLIGFSLPRVR